VGRNEAGDGGDEVIAAELRRVSNTVIIGAMQLSLCVLSIKARYCATPFHNKSLLALDLGVTCFFSLAHVKLLVAAAGKGEDQLQEQMNSSIRMEMVDESPERMSGGQRFSIL
jgi:hypothetical protein